MSVSKFERLPKPPREAKPPGEAAAAATRASEEQSAGNQPPSNITGSGHERGLLLYLMVLILNIHQAHRRLKR